jgi:hypothetical protein
MKFLRTDIFDVTIGEGEYIMTLCDCNSPTKLTLNLEKKYPGTNPFIFPNAIYEPGTLFIIGSENGPMVINVFGDYNGYFPSKVRLEMFEKAMEGLVDGFEGESEHIKIHIPRTAFGKAWRAHKVLLEDLENKMAEAGLKFSLIIYA